MKEKKDYISRCSLFSFIFPNNLWSIPGHLYYKPIIKTPNPRIANYKVTEDQLDMLYLIMLLNKESTDIPIFMGEDEDYLGTDDVKNYRKV